MKTTGRSTEDRCEWILDTHLHLHPQYHIGRVLREFGRRLCEQRTIAPGAVLGGIFTEMRGGYSWEQLCAAEIPGLDGLEIVPVDDGAISFSVFDATIYLFRGAQVVTREGIEVLALLPLDCVTEGDDLRSTIQSIVALRGVPVLPWSPGKWWGKRGRLVREALAHDPRVWVGDISLRWWGRWQPITVRGMEDVPARTLYGSDPLPIAGGEVVVGGLVTGLWLIVGEDASEARKENEPHCATLSERLRRVLMVEGATSRPQGSYQRPLAALRRWMSIIRRKGTSRELGG